jgi:hypothetical protein
MNRALCTIVLAWTALNNASTGWGGEMHERQPVPLEPLQLTLDCDHFNGKFAVECAWPLQSAKGDKLRSDSFLGIARTTLIYVDPHFGNAGGCFRPLFLPYRWTGQPQLELRTDATCALIVDTAAKKTLYCALDLSKKGGIERMRTMGDPDFTLFLLVTDQACLDAALAFLGRQKSTPAERGLALSAFGPVIRKAIPESVGCIVLDNCDLQNTDCRSFTRVRQLQIGHSTNVHLKGIENAADLRRLSLDYISPECEDVPLLSSLRHVEYLSLSGSAGGMEACLPHIRSLPRLRELRLHFDGYRSFDGIEALPALQSLAITGSAEDVRTLTALGRIADLRILELDGVGNVSSIPAIHTLELLEVRNAYDVDSIPSLSRMSRLIYVNLRETAVRTRSALSHAKGLKYCYLSDESNSGLRKRRQEPLLTPSPR